MDKKTQPKLTEGSRYRIISIGGRENPLETEGIFMGFSNLGIDEIGLIMNRGDDEEKKGNTRLIPLHAILAIDILDEKKHEKKEENSEANHYYG
jgi:hypothetical protein